MRMVFRDTVGLLAIWDQSDQWQAAARAAYDKIVRERVSPLTTTFVLLECGNAAARRPYRNQVGLLRERLASRNELIVPTVRDWELAWSAYERGEAGDAGIVDHVSFVVMRRLGITDAFTNDRHFKAAGFNTLF